MPRPSKLTPEVLAAFVGRAQLHNAGETLRTMEQLTEGYVQLARRVADLEGGGGEPITFDAPRWPAGSGVNGN